MMEQQQEQFENEKVKPLSSRLKSQMWVIRKLAYEQILQAIRKAKSMRDEISLKNQMFTIPKFTAFLNNLVEQKHPNILLKGLQCVEAVLKLDPKAGKLFNKLVVEGLERFPLITQQRTTVLQRFSQILQLCKIESSVLSNRLNLPHEKSVMFVIEVIGALRMASLKAKLIQISKKHPKKQVKEVAAEVASELVGEEGEKEELKVKNPPRGVGSKKQEQKKVFRMDLLDKLSQFEGLNAKQQQNYSEQLLESIEEISGLPSSGSLSSFSYLIQLMIESNNQIISTNGVKMLASLVRNKSQLINPSFPLLFIFRKFKIHKTHTTNSNLFNLIQALLCSWRSNDLMNAICEGIGCQENKANLKYGCIVSFIRVFCYYYRQPELFSIYCLGEYGQLYDQIQNKKYIQKMLLKCFDIFNREKQKDKEYAAAIAQMKAILGMGLASTLPSQKSSKQIRNQNKSPIVRNKSNLQNGMKTQEIAKIGKGKANPVKTPILSPEGQFSKIVDLIQSEKVSESLLSKGIERCLTCTKAAIQQNVYDMFYYCDILDSFIDNYRPNELTDELISHFLIDYLKILSAIEIKPSKKQSKITESGLEYLLKLSITKLVLSKELLLILANLLRNYGFDKIIKCLGSLYVMGESTPKKKNKKYLLKWLEQNASAESLGNQYFEVIEAIENMPQHKKSKNNLIAPPSIINLPSYNSPPQPPSQVQNVRSNQARDDMAKKQELVVKMRPGVQELQILQNADISKIQQIEEQSTDRLDEKWEYFLNKKGINLNPLPNSQGHLDHSNHSHHSTHSEEQQKFNYSQYEPQEKQIDYYHQVEPKKQERQQSKPQMDEAGRSQGEGEEEQASVEGDEKEQQPEGGGNAQSEKRFEYRCLDAEKINYMVENSANPFNHLRTLILIPFKSHPNKPIFLNELTLIIQSQNLKKPQPFKSILLIVVLLFTEIKNDRTIIEPLQFLYEYLAQHCSNNQFLKAIISLYNSVIDQTEEGERKMLLTIITKSMVRIMPFVENAVELLKDFQQFYQIGEIVYFEMFPQEYQQIKQVIEHSDSLEDVIYKAFQEEGEGLIAIVEGWLSTGFKAAVKSILQQWVEAD